MLHPAPGQRGTCSSIPRRTTRRRRSRCSTSRSTTSSGGRRADRARRRGSSATTASRRTSRGSSAATARHRLVHRPGGQRPLGARVVRRVSRACAPATTRSSGLATSESRRRSWPSCSACPSRPSTAPSSSSRSTTACRSTSPSPTGRSHPQHYAFLVSEDGVRRDLRRASGARPRRTGPTRVALRPGEINTNDGGRGVYWRTRRPLPRDHHPPVRQRRLTDDPSEVHPEARYRRGRRGSARPCGARTTSPELSHASGGGAHYLATGASTDGEFGLYRLGHRVRLPVARRRTSTHPSRSRSSSCPARCACTTAGSWVDGTPGDFLYVPQGGIHGFRNESGRAGVDAHPVHAGRAAGGLLRDAGRRAPQGHDARTSKAEFFLRHDTFWT